MTSNKRADVFVWVGLAAMIAGAWGPWVAHANAGMSFGVIDLVEFVKLMSRAGLTFIVRELFYLPLLAAAIGAALWAGLECKISVDTCAHVSDLKFQIVTAGAALLTLVALPPYPDLLSAYRSPENGPSFWMSVVALSLVLAAAAAGRRIPRRAAAGVLIILALGSTAPATWQFIQLYHPLSQLYGAPAQVGWGFIITVAGSLLTTIGAISG